VLLVVLRSHHYSSHLQELLQGVLLPLQLRLFQVARQLVLDQTSLLVWLFEIGVVQNYNRQRQTQLHEELVVT
jgi:hypothetical protein